ncbi:anti-sigma factor domain-containing protein [Brachybacterium vulturis]|uniref:anti-sigma factor domain-containing protein n=1 Tax=Brachybacterium vulturis TaxID=2017484 RepID=UPI0037351A26
MNEQKHTMTGAWALNALDAEEREQMRRYLEEDPEAAAEAAAFEETAAELAGGLPPLAPRPELKAAVMARIGTTRQLSPLPEQEESPRTDATGPETPAVAAAAAPSPRPVALSAEDAPAPPSPPAQVVSLDRYRASRRRNRWTTVAAAALLLTTIAGAGLWNSERTAEQEARASLEAMASEQASTEAERATLATILAADDAAHVAIPSQVGGSLQLLYSREQGAMFMQAADLPALPADETYQLWMIDDSGIASAGMLEEPAAAVIHDGAIPEGVTVGLTIEPAGGSAQPTTEPIAAGVLS